MSRQLTISGRVKRFKELMVTKNGKPILSENQINTLTTKGFFTAPASTIHHGNYPGGLFDHCYSVTKHLLGLTEKLNLVWFREESPYIVGMFHDLCKIDAYTITSHPSDPDIVFSYNKDEGISGHGDKSIMLLSQYMTLTEEEIYCIRYHMGAFTDKSEWNKYTHACGLYPNVLWTHTADMLASQVEGV